MQKVMKKFSKIGLYTAKNNSLEFSAEGYDSQADPSFKKREAASIPSLCQREGQGELFNWAGI